jgi:CelD/BcsL family acetyltransferase involved in cellulose biosynthesis
MNSALFMSPQMERFFRAMSGALAGEGLMRLFMMDLDGRPAASVLCFDCCRQLHLYNSGFDPELSSLSVGLLSKVLCLEVAIKEGKGCLDFLRGSEPYKYDLGGHDLPIYRCRVRRS